jgi:hypothetical protein
VANEAEQAVLTDIGQLRSTGASMQAIADELTRRGGQPRKAGLGGGIRVYNGFWIGIFLLWFAVKRANVIQSISCCLKMA